VVLGSYRYTNVAAAAAEVETGLEVGADLEQAGLRLVAEHLEPG
jgi:hypothetical protein